MNSLDNTKIKRMATITQEKKLSPTLLCTRIHKFVHTRQYVFLLNKNSNEKFYPNDTAKIQNCKRAKINTR